MPRDEQYLIDSLSDSTVYMAFYTVAHLLQADIYGKTGSSGIPPSALSKEVWDYIFLRGNYPANCSIPEETLQTLRREFEFWYPVDLRVSGKDLITNHLVFFLYNHAALWPQQEKTRWPTGIRANGHVLLNGEKMSKSTGNFLTLREAIEQFSADGMRFGLADAGDTLDDANVTTKMIDTGILRLYAQLEWIEEMLSSKELRSGAPSTFLDLVFESQMNRCIQEADLHYARTNFREALKSSFFDLQRHRDDYRSAVLSIGDQMNKLLIYSFIEVQAIIMAPITPHWSEYIWTKLLGRKGSVRIAAWPSITVINEELLKKYDYLQKVLHAGRLKLEYYLKNSKAKEKIEADSLRKLTIYVALKYPEYQEKTLNLMRPFFEEALRKPGNSNDSSNKTIPIDDKQFIRLIAEDSFLKKMMKKVMPFVGEIKRNFQERGMSVFDIQLPFDEKELLLANLTMIKESLTVNEVEIVYANEEEGQKCSPGIPLLVFHS